MLPKFVKVIHSFPLTPNGKIDKKSLLSIGVEKNNLKKYSSPLFSNLHNWSKSAKVQNS
jgi:hypothetical protein